MRHGRTSKPGSTCDNSLRRWGASTTQNADRTPRTSTTVRSTTSWAGGKRQTDGCELGDREGWESMIEPGIHEDAQHHPEDPCCGHLQNRTHQHDMHKAEWVEQHTSQRRERRTRLQSRRRTAVGTGTGDDDGSRCFSSIAVKPKMPIPGARRPS